MAPDQSALLEVMQALKAVEVDDRIRQAAETIYQALIEAELSSVIGAMPHQRTDSRTAWRNGHRPRTVTITPGDLELRIPRLRAGSFFPSLLERRRRAGQSLFAVIMEAYLHGTSTRKVDDMVNALGAGSGISKSEISRICAELDTEVAAFRDRSLGGQPFGYVFLDANLLQSAGGSPRSLPGRGGRHRGGRRRATGGARLRRGRQRGRRVLDRVLALFGDPRRVWGQLVISDAHAGLTAAIAAVLIGASWQRCRVH